MYRCGYCTTQIFVFWYEREYSEQRMRRKRKCREKDSNRTGLLAPCGLKKVGVFYGNQSSVERIIVELAEQRRSNVSRHVSRTGFRGSRAKGRVASYGQ